MSEPFLAYRARLYPIRVYQGLAALGSLDAWQADRSVSAIPMVYFPLQQHTGTSLMSVYYKMACCHSPFDLFAIIVINSSISMVPLPSVSTSCSITSSSSGVGSCPSALITYNVVAQLFASNFYLVILAIHNWS